jgi:hypothetical protein
VRTVNSRRACQVCYRHFCEALDRQANRSCPWRSIPGVAARSLCSAPGCSDTSSTVQTVDRARLAPLPGAVLVEEHKPPYPAPPAEPVAGNASVPENGHDLPQVRPPPRCGHSTLRPHIGRYRGGVGPLQFVVGLGASGPYCQDFTPAQPQKQNQPTCRQCRAPGGPPSLSSVRNRCSNRRCPR